LSCFFMVDGCLSKILTISATVNPCIATNISIMINFPQVGKVIKFQKKLKIIPLLIK
jgi:hypothetical protein